MKQLFLTLICFNLILSPLAYSAEDKYLTTGTGSSGGYDFYTKQILGLGTSIIGASIIKQCTSGLRIPSIATFMAGSVVNIWGEINASKSEHKYQMTRLSQIKIKEEQLAKKGGEFQKQVLLENLDSERKTVEFLKKRKSWMIAVDAIYLAAMGLAIAEQGYSTVAAMGGGIGKCAQIAAQQASSCGPGYAACYATHFAACSGIQPTGMLTAQSSFALEKAKEIAEKTCMGTAIYKDACDTALKIYTNLAFGACKSTPTDGGLLSLSFPKLLSLGWGFMAKKAGGEGPINQYGKMMYTLLGVLVPKLHKLTPKAYNFPIPRAITFGVFSGLAISVTTGLATRQKKAEQNVALLEKVINKFELETAPNGGLAEAPPVANDYLYEQQDGPTRSPASSNVTPLPTVAQNPTECLSMGQEITHNAQNCNNPLKFASPDFSNMPNSTLTNVSNQSIQLANAISIGDTTKADILAESISAQASRVKIELEKIQRDYNNAAKNDPNAKPVDFEKSIKDEIAGLESEFNNSSNSSNIKLSELGKPVEDDSSKDGDTNSADANSVAAHEQGMNTIPQIPAMPVPDFGADIADAGSEEAAIGRSLANEASNSSADFVSNVPLETEVGVDSEVSLFKRVSERYLLNYSRIFERKKDVDSEWGLPQ